MAKTKATKKKAKRKTRTQDCRLSLTQDIIDQTAKIVSDGNFRTVARGKLGIPQSTWESWIDRGRKEIREYAGGNRTNLTLKAKLVQALDKAESDNHATIIENVMTTDNLKLKMDYLFRRYPRLYAHPTKAIDDETGETVEVDPLQLLADKLGKFIEG